VIRTPGWIAGTVVVAMAVAASVSFSAPPAQVSNGEWTMIAATNVLNSGALKDPRLAEASGAALSRANPGVIWTIGDSGNPPDLLAIDTTGALRAVFAVGGATNIDWEEVAVGPCGQQTCVYIADTGDNGERRSDVVLYRVAEPTIPGDSRATTQTLAGVERIRLVYPDRPHDVEAMAVTGTGEILLVTKGRSAGVLVFSIPPAAWPSGQTITPLRRDSLPITAVGGMGREVTGMALSPDGKRVVVRTYRDLYPFALRRDGTFAPLGAPTACDILGREPQGEGITFLNPRRLLLTSERGLFKVGTILTLECAPLNQ
jgi:hypothetical protein